MPNFFERALTPLARLGVIDLLVFLLVFIIFYIFLNKTEVLGKRANKNISSVIALSTALIFINIIPGEVFLQYFLWLILAFVALIFLLILMSFAGVEQYKMNYLIGGILGIVVILVFSQMIKSELAMSFVLSMGVLAFLIVAFLQMRIYALLIAAAANIVLAFMAFNLGFERAVENVYFSGITLGLTIFALLLWFILHGGEVAVKEKKVELEEQKKKESEEKKREQKKREVARLKLPETPVHDFSKRGEFGLDWEKEDEELDRFMQEEEAAP